LEIRTLGTQTIVRECANAASIFHLISISISSVVAMLYLDNPVGVGFSFTTSEQGYSNNTHDAVGKNIYSFLSQFFTIFHQYRQNDFYSKKEDEEEDGEERRRTNKTKTKQFHFLAVTGESYAGKYVPSAAHWVHVQNQQVPPQQKINLKVNICSFLSFLFFIIHSFVVFSV
jgi:vitellogenic carboxypeptidase-like protein